MRCLTDAWTANEAELRRFLRHRSGGDAEGDDLLQEVFLRASKRVNGLCGIDNPRAWLFHVARNLLIDRLRLARESLPLPDDLADETLPAPAPIDSLTQCLPRALAELTADERDVITRCDLEGVRQKDYAALRGLSLPAAKSRLLRARARLKAHLTAACQVRFGANGEVCGFVPREPTSS